MKRLLLNMAAAVGISHSSAAGTYQPQPLDTQIVVQWPISTAKDVAAYMKAERVIERASNGLYFEDGNDIGMGAFNVFIYTNRVDETIARIVDLGGTQKFPAGFRIGVAVYKDKAHTDWTFRLAYPQGPGKFELELADRGRG